MAWSAGAILTAAQLNNYLPQAWSSWTPVLTGTTNPAIGNGTAVGRYIQYGKTVIFTVKITFGSTSTFGSGAWFLSLPVARASGGVVRADFFFEDASTSNRSRGYNYAGTTTTLGIAYDDGTAVAAAVTPTAPFTWTTSDSIEVVATYEVP